MTRKQFNAALDQLGLNNSQAARTLGIARSSVLRYAAGEIEVPVYVERLIVMLQQHGVPEDWR